MFTPLHSSTNQELFEKHVCNQSGHYEKYYGAARPGYRLKLKCPLPSLSTMFDLNWYTVVQIKECLKSTSVLKVATVKNMNNFSLRKGSHHMQPPN